MMEYKITTPVSKEDLLKLHAGDRVLLSGIVYTARDQAHKMMAEAIEKGKKLPFDLEGSAIYYVGPTPECNGRPIGSAGPTTSGRMDVYSPLLMDKGNAIMIGKGKRNEEVIASIKKNKAVYLGALGGAGALLAECIKESNIIAWPELGCEAVRKLKVEDMPLTVIVDTDGNNAYVEGPKTYLERGEK